MFLLIFAFFITRAAMLRLDQGKPESAWFLAAVALVFVIGGVVQIVLDDD